MALTLEILSDLIHMSPRNSAGHTLFLSFASVARCKSESLGTEKQLGNVNSVVEYSKIVTAHQLGDHTHFFRVSSCLKPR